MAVALEAWAAGEALEVRALEAWAAEEAWGVRALEAWEAAEVLGVRALEAMEEENSPEQPLTKHWIEEGCS